MKRYRRHDTSVMTRTMVIKTKQSSKADYDRHNYDDNDDNTTITMTTNDYTKWLTFLFFHVPAQLVNTAPFPYFSHTLEGVSSPSTGI